MSRIKDFQDVGKLAKADQYFHEVCETGLVSSSRDAETCYKDHADISFARKAGLHVI